MKMKVTMKVTILTKSPQKSKYEQIRDQECNQNAQLKDAAQGGNKHVLISWIVIVDSIVLLMKTFAWMKDAKNSMMSVKEMEVIFSKYYNLLVFL